MDLSQGQELAVHIARDEETGIWYIAQSDIPGLRLEGDTVSDLLRKIEDVAPDLIELNAEEIAVGRRARSGGAPLGLGTMNIRPVFDSTMSVAR